MPRRRPDQVFEHRISLSDFERQRIDEVITTAQANVAVDGITSTLNAAAGIGIGGAALLSAYVFMKWKSPTVIIDLITGVADKVTNPIVDNIADFLVFGTPIELRREAQRLAKERGIIASLESNYCSLSSGNYNEAQCSAAQIRKDAYFIELEALRVQVADQALALGGSVDGLGLGAAFIKLVFGGLGDIDPNFQA